MHQHAPAHRLCKDLQLRGLATSIMLLDRQASCLPGNACVVPVSLFSCLLLTLVSFWKMSLSTCCRPALLSLLVHCRFGRCTLRSWRCHVDYAASPYAFFWHGVVTLTMNSHILKLKGRISSWTKIYRPWNIAYIDQFEELAKVKEEHNSFGKFVVTLFSKYRDISVIYFTVTV